METIESKQINDWLKGGPQDPLGNKPLFRLVWSDETYEVRNGTFSDWFGDIKIREYTKTERVLKYNWIKERWVLEGWRPPEVVLNPELPESYLGSYEPIFVFEDADFNPLPLRLDVVQKRVKDAIGPKRSEFQRRIDSKNIQEEKERAAFNADLECLQDEGPLVSQFHDGSAILRP